MKAFRCAISTAVCLFLGFSTAPQLAYASFAPSLVFSTYVTGTGNDTVNGVAIDPIGNVVVVGETTSLDLPLGGTSGPIGGTDAFVAKFDPAGRLIFLRYLGGSDEDRALRVTIDSAGAAYVAGTTRSRDFPTTPGALQTIYGGGQLDTFVVKVGLTGDVAFSTYLGGDDLEGGHSFETDLGIAVGSDGGIYLAGWTTSSNFPVTPGAYQTECVIPCWQPKPFVAKLNATATTLSYATYVGTGYATSIAVDAAGNAFIGGRSFGGFPSVAPLPASGDGDDAFAAKLNSTGSTLLYASKFGGGGSDIAQAIAVDDQGSAYLTGLAGCRFPTTAGAFQPATLPCNANPSFIVKISPSGSDFAYATMLTGPENTTATKSIAVDGTRRAHVSGMTTSPALPMVSPIQSAISGFSDAFLVTMNASGSGIDFSTYIGGTLGEQANAVALGPNGSIAVVGSTSSTNFPTLAANQASSAGGTCFSFGFPSPCSDGFVYVVGSPADLTPPTIVASPDRAPDHNGWYSAPVTITFTCSDASGIATCPAPVTLGTDGSAVSFSGTATDSAGNTATASGTVQIDQTGPTIAYTGNSGTYTVDQTISIECAASDALSGIDTETCAAIAGPAYTFPLGSNTFTSNATDFAGNLTAASTTFTVTVTPASLCSLTTTFTHSSDRYATLSPAQRAQVDQLTKVLCDRIASITTGLEPAQKASAINVYTQGVMALQKSGWLTSAEATILKNLAASL